MEKTSNTYLHLVFFREFLIGSYYLNHTAFQHLLQRHLGQGMASNPIDFLAQAEQEGLYIPGRLKEQRSVQSPTRTN